jgi:hypothetical protein
MNEVKLAPENFGKFEFFAANKSDKNFSGDQPCQCEAKKKFNSAVTRLNARKRF